MIAAFNCIVIALVLLIAYWWASQGVLSAFLHLVCVIVATGLAFATWETLAVLLFKQGWIENYAWGVTLLLPFAIYLLIARIASDKIVANNVNLPQWANLTFGGALGFVSGVLTVGVCLLGGGLLQGSNELMGFRGSYRTSQAHGQPEYDAEKLWFPVHKVTASTVGWLGANSLAPEMSRSTWASYPKLGDQAFSLHRDSFENGRARTSAPIDAVSFGGLYFSPEYKNDDGTTGAYALELEVGSTAADSGGVVTVTASQIRLIEDLPSSSRREAEISHPLEWTQPLESGGRQPCKFDDMSNVASNVPGQQSTKFFFIFPSSKLGNPDSGGLPPRYVQFKGLRLRLPTLDASRPTQEQLKQITMGVAGSPNDIPLFDATKKTVASKDITVNKSIAPAVISLNELANMEQSDQLLTEGTQEFRRGGPAPSSANKIKGIYVQDGTAMVRLNISRRLSSIDLWNDRTKTREEAGESATLYLVDSNNNQYAPIGYVWVKPDGVEISLQPKRGIPTIADFPNQPSSGSHELYALFNPTAKVKIVSVRLGNKVVANVDFEAIPGD